MGGDLPVDPAPDALFRLVRRPGSRNLGELQPLAVKGGTETAWMMGNFP